MNVYETNVRTHLGVDVFLRLALLDLEQRWARDEHVSLLDQRSLQGEIKSKQRQNSTQQKKQINERKISYAAGGDR